MEDVNDEIMYLTNGEEEEGEEASRNNEDDDCSSSNNRCIHIVGWAFVITMIFQVFFFFLFRNGGTHHHHARSSYPSRIPITTTTTTTRTSASSDSYSIRLLHMGNSIQYFNDAPHVLHSMLRDSSPQLLINPSRIEHRVCLRGGSNLLSLYQKGTTWYRRSIGVDFGVSKVQDLFSTNTAAYSHHQGDNNKENKAKADGPVDYQFAIFNDYTQSPARPPTRQESLNALKTDYLPLLMMLSNNNQHHHSIPVFIQTAAYRKDYDYGTQDIGTFDRFTQALWEGYTLYQTKLSDWMSWPQKSSAVYIAPMGMGYQEMKQRNSTAWRNLYVNDNKHPSEQGTLLQAYLLYMTIVHHITTTTQTTNHPEKKVVVPPYNPRWFPKFDSPTPIFGPVVPPTKQEAEEILKVAYKVFYQYQQQEQQQQPQH